MADADEVIQRYRIAVDTLNERIHKDLGTYLDDMMAARFQVESAGMWSDRWHDAAKAYRAEMRRLRALLAAYGRAGEERDEDVAADALRDIEEEARAQHAAGTGG